MDSKKVHQRKKLHSNINSEGEDNQSGAGLQRDSSSHGVDWKCAILILTIVFVTVFVTSVSWGVGGLPTLDRLRKGLWQKETDTEYNTEHSHRVTVEDSSHLDLGEGSPKNWPKDEPSPSPSSFIEKTHEENSKEKPAPATTVLDKPTILWWTDALFPHAHRGHVSEINCGEHTCLSTSDKSILSDPLTRGILFYGTDFRAYEAPLPRKSWHEWALLHEESPMNNYILVHAMKLFNHSATFRRESDYPTTTHSLPNLEFLTERKPIPIEEKNQLRKKKKLAPILYVQSHCDVAGDRDRYVKELMKHIKVDSYGKCENNKKMPEHMSDPVESMEADNFYTFIAKYKFHLAFENALCDDYITEKFFRPFHVGSVPIYRGSSSAADWAPAKKSFINVNDFESPEQLAYFIKLLDEHDDLYLNYLTFKEQGITNKFLLDYMNNRKYAVNEWDKHSFISGFECHVCEKISERYRAEQGGVHPSHPLLEKKIGQSVQMGCPPPDVSVGKMEDVPDTDGIHTWVEDYWGMRIQAVALEKMLEEGESDASKLFDVVERLHNEQQWTS